jgi:hypothetical protein
MAELLRLASLPGPTAYIVIVLGTCFAVVELAHRILGLLRAWDEYRAARLEALRRG